MLTLTFFFQICSLTIEFEIRTEAESGLLFYMARINHADFATVQIKDGFPHFRYDLGSGDTSTMIPNRINDGLWHKVICLHDGRVHKASAAVINIMTVKPQIFSKELVI